MSQRSTKAYRAAKRDPIIIEVMGVIWGLCMKFEPMMHARVQLEFKQDEKSDQWYEIYQFIQQMYCLTASWLPPEHRKQLDEKNKSILDWGVSNDTRPS